MKKNLKITMGLIIAAIAFVSCGKDDGLSTQQKLQNKWIVDSISLRNVTPTTNNIITVPGQPGDYYDFRGDGKLYFQFNGSKDTLLYSLLDGNRLATDNNGVKDTGIINTLTNTRLIGVTKHVNSSTDYSEVTAYLRR